MGELVHLLIYVGVAAIIGIALWYVLSQLALPEPIRRIIMVVLVIVIAIVAIAFLLQLGGLSLIH
jgi:hypothetical protein